MKATLTTLGLLFALVACNKASELQEGSAILVDPNSPSINEDTTITVVNADQYRVFKWAIVDEGGQDAAGCSAMETAVVTCAFETPGLMTIRLAATDRNGKSEEFERSIDVLDPAAKANQSPFLVLNLKNGSGTSYGTVATLRKEESGSAIFPRNQPVVFDFSATRDDRDIAEDLKFEIDMGAGFLPIGMVSTQIFPSVATLATTIRATDSDGNKTDKQFTIFVQCNPGDQPAVAINTGAISISADATNNWFSFNASSAVSGGIGGYKVKYDFNGDGMFDNDWSTNTAIREYTNFSGVRDVGIKVWELGCNYFASTTFAHNFNIPTANGVSGVAQGPQIPGYHFIQASMTGLMGNAVRSVNANYIASHSMTAPSTDVKKVECDYRKKGTSTSSSLGSNAAAFYIHGLNVYQRTGESNIPQGMAMHVAGIIDPTGMAGAGSVDTSGAFIEKAGYYTDGGSDQLSAGTYLKASDCTLNLAVTPFPPGPGTCSDNPEYGYPVQLDGTYNCPRMVDANGLEVAASTGAFFCEVAKVQACPPGGGGGGGGLPPIGR